MRFFLVLIGVAGLAAAQDAPVTSTLVTSKSTPTASAPLFGTGSWFKTSLWTPETPKIELRNPVRLEDHVAGDKLELSLRSYIDLVLANNTDLMIERLSIEPTRNDILRRHAIFDPLFLGSFQATRTLTPASDELAGALSRSDLNQPALFRYQQLLPTGTQFNVSFNASKFSTNNAFANFNPALNTGFNMNFSQPLLRGRGAYITRLQVTIARSRLRQDEYSIQNRMLTLVSAAENAYWDVVLARENLRVQEQALALADASLKRAQRELELGAISQLEIYQPQQQYATFDIRVTQARFRLEQAEDALRRQIGADLNPAVRNLPIVLTESIATPSDASLDKEGLIETALRLRPDLKARRQQLDVDDLTIQATTNALKPNLSLTGQYGASGRGGNQLISEGFGQNRQIIGINPGGLGDAFDQLFGFGYPVYGFGLRLEFPLRDRRAQADYADSVVNKRLDLLRLRQAEQNARLEVVQALSAVESSRASVELAKVALDFAQKRVEGDQRRYDLGTITLFFLLDSQNALTQAQSELVNQSVNYRRNLVTLRRLTGELLAERNIAVQ